MVVIYENGLPALTERFKFLENKINRTTMLLDAMNSGLFRLGARIDGVLERGYFSWRIEAQSKEKIPEAIHREDTESFQDLLAATGYIGKIAKSALKTYETVEELPAKIEGVRKGIEAFEGIGGMAVGVEKLAGSTGFLEGLGALTAIMSGIESLSAGVMFGPAGLIAGGAIALGGIATVKLNEQFRKELHDREERSFDKVAKNNENDFLLSSNQNDKRAAGYIHQWQQGSGKSTSQINKEAETLKNQFLHNGGTINFDWELAERKDPVYLKALVSALTENDQRVVKPIKQLVFGDENDSTAFRQQFDRFNHFPLSVAPKVAKLSHVYSPHRADGPGISYWYQQFVPKKQFEQEEREKHRNANKMETVFHDTILLNIVQSYLTNGLGYVQNEYQAKLNGMPQLKVQINKVWDDFLNIKKIIDRDDPEKDSVHVIRPTGKGRYTDRDMPIEVYRTRYPVTINLNKSLIENFTINVKDGTEGLKDFKRKVEEVLIEVLNQANVIK